MVLWMYAYLYRYKKPFLHILREAVVLSVRNRTRNVRIRTFLYTP